MIFCIFTTSFYDIVIFVDSITNTTTIIGNLQTNSCFMPRALNKVSQIVKRGGGKSPPVRWGESEILVGGGDFFTGWWEPKEEWFWRFELFSRRKKHSVSTEHQLKSKLCRMTCVSWNLNKNGTGAMTTANLFENPFIACV